MDSSAGTGLDDNSPGQGAGSQRGRPSDVSLLIRTVRDPARWWSLSRGQRAAVERLRDKFPREVLALIVCLQDLIEATHRSRDAFVVHLDMDRSSPAGRVTKQTLHHHLGGRRCDGPDWWLAQLIATHCVPRDEDPQLVLDNVRQLWQAAHGAPPDGLAAVTPATPQMISELIDLPFDPDNPEAEAAYHISRRYSAAVPDGNGAAAGEEFSPIAAGLTAEDEARAPSAAPGKPSRLRGKEILRIIGALLIVSLLIWSFFFRAKTTKLVYRSGTRPRTPVVVEGGECPGSSADCLSQTRPNGFQWRVGPRIRDKTTFGINQRVGGTGTYLTGFLQYSSARCPGSQVAWSIDITGSPHESGILNGIHRQTYVYQRIPDGHPIITVQIDRTDNLSCTTGLTWNPSLQQEPPRSKVLIGSSHG